MYSQNIHTTHVVGSWNGHRHRPGVGVHWSEHSRSWRLHCDIPHGLAIPWHQSTRYLVQLLCLYHRLLYLEFSSIFRRPTAFNTRLRPVCYPNGLGVRCAPLVSRQPALPDFPCLKKVCPTTRVGFTGLSLVIQVAFFFYTSYIPNPRC